MIRHATNYVTTAANTNTQDFAFTTIDDYRIRHIKYVYLGITTSGVRIGLYVKGQLYTEVDATRFASGNYLVEVEFDVPATIQLHVALTNLAGTALTNVPVLIGYQPEGLP